jgi:hypothetical protein
MLPVAPQGLDTALVQPVRETVRYPTAPPAPSSPPSPPTPPSTGGCLYGTDTTLRPDCRGGKCDCSSSESACGPQITYGKAGATYSCQQGEQGKCATAIGECRK